MIRQIIKIDEDRCNGCGLCADACHEGAIGIVDGKARLLRDDFCDGMGDCLPECPSGAITFEKREALAYDESAVAANKLRSGVKKPVSENIKRKFKVDIAENPTYPPLNPRKSELSQWPVQIKLSPVKARYFENSELLIAADCTAYAYADFHNDFISGKVTLIGCPKLDSIDYGEKLSEILINNSVKNIMVVRMEVPCCGGIVSAVKRAADVSGKKLPVEIFTISSSGNITDIQKF